MKTCLEAFLKKDVMPGGEEMPGMTDTLIDEGGETIRVQVLRSRCKFAGGLIWRCRNNFKAFSGAWNGSG